MLIKTSNTKKGKYLAIAYHKNGCCFIFVGTNIDNIFTFRKKNQFFFFDILKFYINNQYIVVIRTFMANKNAYSS